MDYRPRITVFPLRIQVAAYQAAPQGARPPLELYLYGTPSVHEGSSYRMDPHGLEPVGNTEDSEWSGNGVSSTRMRCDIRACRSSSPQLIICAKHLRSSRLV